MLPVISALKATTAHGLPRTVTGKPMHVRFSWMLVFLVMSGLFFKGFIDFIIKLQQRQVTTSLEADSLHFQFPDVYICFENPISASYAANIDADSANEINSRLRINDYVLKQQIATVADSLDEQINMFMETSFVNLQSLPYRLLVDKLAHRPEQDVISSDVTYRNGNGLPEYKTLPATSFYHPRYMRCYRWILSADLQSKVLQTGLSSGLDVTLLLDSSFAGMNSTGHPIEDYVITKDTPVPVSDWSLSVGDFNTLDRRLGIRIFLTSPGEYPSDFVDSFSLAPGKHHTVNMIMTRHVKKEGQFDCSSDTSDVQFLNPYDQTPYSHKYSYSYCFYYEYHKQFQELVNLSGVISPLPWPLRDKKFVLNLTGDPNFFVFYRDKNLNARVDLIANETKSRCQSKQPCNSLTYSVSISSSDWPAQSSVGRYVRTSIAEALMRAKSKNLSVPALEFLLNSNESTMMSYVRNNLLKVHFKPDRVLSDEVTFSIDYGLQNFISDVGGIMGIYLGMSLLTLCEFIEFIYDLIVYGQKKAEKSIKDARSSVV